jgi:hypothetical protein
VFGVKIYILPVNEIIQPSSTWLLYPEHNDDYDLEQDFLNYLRKNSQLLTENSQEADYHYLPAFWTRWVYNHNWGNDDLDLLQLYVAQAILDDSKTFTVCQTSDLKIDLGKKLVFIASRNSDEVSNRIDIPLVCRPHSLPAPMFGKKYLASFVGRFNTHPIRQKMVECFENVADTFLVHHSEGTDFFVEKILESYVTLCPRGYGGSSFRFFETMQLGGVPIFIGIPDVRPFKKYINWDECSLYAETPQQAVAVIDDCRKDTQANLLAMGEKGAKLWEEHLCYGKWCDYVIKELHDLQGK